MIFVEIFKQMKNEKEKQPERFGVGRGKFLIELTSPKVCLVSIRKRNGEVEWQEYLPIEFAQEFGKVELLEKKADTLRKGRDRWEKKTLELRNEVEALTETLSKVNEKHAQTNEELEHQMKRVIELEEKASNLEILLNASKEAQEYLRIENASLIDGKKYLTERNEELTNQLAQSENKRAALQADHDTQMHEVETELFAERQKYQNLLQTFETKQKDSTAYFWLSLITILCLLGFALWK